LSIYWQITIEVVRKADVVECLAVEERKGAFHSQTNEAWFTKPQV
jgi:hypothetical protein